jgi:hypothetical protein
MRLAVLIAALAVAAPIGLYAGSASAQIFQDQSVFFGRRHGPQAAWCSHQDAGGENVQEDCSYNSFDACRRALMGIASSFCTQNAAYDLTVQPVRNKKGNRLPR